MSVLEARSVSCSIGSSLILDSVTFDILKGEFVSLIGPNGAGKTTLLKCLMKILPISGGTINVEGQDIRSVNQKRLASYMAYVPQADSRYLPFTAGEFVMTGRYPHLSPFTSFSEDDKAAVKDAMILTKTERLFSRRMSSLSGGEKQLVMIAASIAQGAGIMLLDEPAAFLDPAHERSVMRLLLDINEKKGTTVVMVTHDINRAIIASGRSLVLNGGRVEYFSMSAGLSATGVLERVYDRDFDYIQHPTAGCDIILPDVK